MPTETPRRVLHDISTGAVIKVLAILALCGILYYIRDIILIVLVAVVISAAIEPSTKWLVRHKIPRVPAVILEYVVLAAALAVIFYYLVIPLIGEAVNFIQSLPSYIQSLDAWSLPAGLAGQAAQNATSSAFSVQSIVNQLNGAVSDISHGFFSTLSTIFGGAFSFILIVVLSLYLSVQEGKVANFLAMISPAKQRPYVLRLWTKSESKIGRWMQGQLLLGAIIGVVDYLGLLAFGVPHALLLGFVAGLFEIVPVIGPILSAIPGVLLALASGGISFAIIIVVFYTLVQQLENHIVYPLVVRNVVGVPPVISIIALLVGGELLGFLGIVIAVPVAAIIIEFISDRQKINAEEAVIGAETAE